MNHDTPLRPFPCSSCGAILALGQGKSARCPYCKAETPIPAEYGALQRAAQGFADDRRLAQQLYGTLGKPPSWFARTVGRQRRKVRRHRWRGQRDFDLVDAKQPAHRRRALHGRGLRARTSGRRDHPRRRMALAQSDLWTPPFPVLAFAMVLVLAVIGIPALRFGRERALAEVRASIHASLAAKMPERAGGRASVERAARDSTFRRARSACRVPTAHQTTWSRSQRRGSHSCATRSSGTSCRSMPRSRSSAW